MGYTHLPEDEVQKLFNKLDKDGNGRITKDEMKEFLK